MSYIGVDQLRTLNVDRIMADYYLLERLVADGSRSARAAQVKLESWAAPRLMRYLSAICGGEMRHAAGGEGCEGYECSGEADPDLCQCCGYYRDENHDDDLCSYCGEPEAHSQHDECDCEDDCKCDYDHAFDQQWYCDCFCETELCYACQSAEGGELRIEGLAPDLEEWVRYNSGGSEGGRDGAWREWLEYHDANGARALKQLQLGFAAFGWPGGYGGDAWSFIARVAYEYQSGQMSAHAFMDRCWTLHHNGGNVFDKMYDSYTLDRLLAHQANDKYHKLAARASREVRELWAIRPYVLSDSLDRDPAWLGREIPVGVEW